jgi:WD40 repeat protein/serine/threonine protein kinase
VSEPPPGETAPTPLALELQVDAVCLRFEEAWKTAERRPQPEDYLAEVPPPARKVLVRELLALDLDYRRRVGERPDPLDYRGRLADYLPEVEAVFAELSSPLPGATGPYQPGGAGADEPAQGTTAPPEIAGAEAPGSVGPAASPSESQQTDVPGRGNGTAPGPARTPPEASGRGTPTSAGLRFRILRPHARGGLGEVFVATDQELGRSVALKQIQERFADDPASRNRFLLEAEITGRLEHPGVVPVYGLGADSAGRPFYAMRFIKGDSLKDAIQRFHQADIPGRDPGERALALRELLGRFVAVCNVIAYAHSRGVLHRDLKPANVLLGRYGETLVVDWGLAKPVGRPEGETDAEESTLRPLSADGSAPTLAGHAMGTPQYMPPEQAAGRLAEVGFASDVYGLGATLYCLLTGRPPLEGPDSDVVLRRAQQGDFLPPRRVKRTVPPALEAVCLKAMALRPEERYGSARALADDVEHWLADEPVSAYREPWRQRLGRWARRHRSGVQALAAALVLVTGVAVGAAFLINEAREEAENRRDREAQARVQAEQARQKEEKQRRRAEAARRGEMTARRKEARQRLRAEAARRGEAAARSRAEQALVRRHLGSAFRLMDRDDLAGALLWLAEALRWEQDDPARLEAHRRHFAAVWRANPRLAGVQGHQRPIYAAVFSPDGRRLVTAVAGPNSSGEVQVWDATTGRPALSVWPHPRVVRHVAFSPDGRLLATAAGDGLRIWRVDTESVVATALGSGSARRVWFSPDGQYVLVADWSGRANVRQATSGNLVGRTLKHRQAITQAAFSPDGRRVATASLDPTARLWEVRTGKAVGAGLEHRGPVTWVAFSPDGRRLVTASQDGTARVWDAATGKPLTRPLEHRHPPWLAWFTADSRHLFTAGPEEGGRQWVSLQRWDAATGRPIYPRSQPKGDYIAYTLPSPDGRRLFTMKEVGNSPTREARVWDTASGDSVTIPLAGSVSRKGVAFSPDGRLLATACSGRRSARCTVQVWEIASGKPASKAILLKAPAAAVQVLFSPDGTRLGVVTGAEARIWDALRGIPLSPRWKHPATVWTAVFSPDPRRLRLLTVSRAVPDDPDDPDDEAGPGTTTVSVWELSAPGPVFRRRGDIIDAAFSPHGHRLATVQSETDSRLSTSTVSVYDVLTGETTRPTLKLGPVGVESIQFSTDGRRLLVAGRVWDLASGRPVTPFLHGSELTRFSPDGRYLLATDGHEIKVLDTATGEPITPPLTHRFPVEHAAFSQDGKRLVVIAHYLSLREQIKDEGDIGDIRDFHHPIRERALASRGTVSPDGRRLVIVCGDAVRVWDPETGQPVTPLLRQGGAITHTSFSSDSRRLVVVGANHVTRVWDLAAGFPPVRALTRALEVYTWDLAPLRSELRDLPNLARLVSGATVAETGGEVTLTARDTVVLWDEVRAKEPLCLRVTPGQLEAWRLRQVTDCEAAGNWRCAMAYLDRFAREQPRRWDFVAHRGLAFLHLGERRRAAEDQARAEALDGGRASAWCEQVVAEARDEQDWSTALWYLDRLIKTRPGQPRFYRKRGGVQAERGRWKEAGADFQKAIDLGDRDENTLRRQALAALGGGNRSTYRRVCADLLKRLGETGSSPPVSHVLWTCLLLPRPTAETKQLVSLAERARAGKPNDPACQAVLGAALYRAGRFKEAVRWLGTALTPAPEMQGNSQEERPSRKPASSRGFKVPQTIDSPSDAATSLFLAMAYQRLGRPAEARKCLRLALEWIDGAPRGAYTRDEERPALSGEKRDAPNPIMELQEPPARSWEERVELQTLRRETQSLLKVKKR